MNIQIEATIGAGKTTLVANITELMAEKHATLKVEGITEPREAWEDTPGGNLLQMFGDDPEKYAFMAQVLIMSTLSKQRQKNIAADVVIYERSLDSAVQVFQKTLEQDGTLSLMEVHTLTQLHSALLDTMPIADHIIYLRASPELAFNRAKARNEGGDKQLKLDYVRKLHTNYEVMIENCSKEVLFLEASENENDIAEKAVEWIVKKMKK